MRNEEGISNKQTITFFIASIRGILKQVQNDHSMNKLVLNVLLYYRLDFCFAGVKPNEMQPN